MTQSEERLVFSKDARTAEDWGLRPRRDHRRASCLYRRRAGTRSIEWGAYAGDGQQRHAGERSPDRHEQNRGDRLPVRDRPERTRDNPADRVGVGHKRCIVH